MLKMPQWLIRFQDGNYYEEPYEDFMFINISLITTQVKNNEGTTDLYLDPSMREIRDLLYRCFTKVINVNKNIPRVEAILFEGLDLCPTHTCTLGDAFLLIFFIFSIRHGRLRTVSRKCLRRTGVKHNSGCLGCFRRKQPRPFDIYKNVWGVQLHIFRWSTKFSSGFLWPGILPSLEGTESDLRLTYVYVFSTDVVFIKWVVFFQRILSRKLRCIKKFAKK